MLESNPKVRLLDGNMMPLIGLGTMGFRPNDKTFNLTEFLTGALNLGYTHFDLSKTFENETQLGESLKAIFDQRRQVYNLEGEVIPQQFESVYNRQNLFLSLKVSNTKNKTIVQQLKESLAILKLEYVDLLILNYPYSPTISPQVQEEEENAGNKQPEQPNHVPLHAAWRQMEKCKELGLCKSIGVSNFSISTLADLIPFTQNVPVVNQVESHPWCPQTKMLKFLKKYGIVMGAYCPLGRGGKDQKVILGEKIDFQSDPALKQLSDKYSKTFCQILLNYQVIRGVYVTPKTEKLDHLKDNYNITDFEMLEEDKILLDKLSDGKQVRVYQPKLLPSWKGIDPLC